MAAVGRHEAHDRLQAEVQLMKRRLVGLHERMDQADAEIGEELTGQHKELAERCDSLAEELKSWHEVEVGIPTAVGDLSDAVDALEADLDAMAPTDAAGYEVAVDRQVRAWRSRVDRLRLQGALGTMEARDDLHDMSKRLDRVRGDALIDLQDTLGDTKDVVEDLRDNVEEVLGDIRQAVRKAAKNITER